MKSKYGLLKVLLVLLAFVAAGVIYSCASGGSSSDVQITEDASLEEVDVTGETVRRDDIPDGSEGLICVHVCGAVKNPGVYYLKEGSRLHEAVEIAGGLSDDAAASYVNLAGIVMDGEQIYIPDEEEAEAGIYPDADRQMSADDGLVNINTADVSQLMTLTGIGQSKADAIIAYRDNVAAFKSTEDILNVSGIGNSIYEKIKDSIKV